MIWSFDDKFIGKANDNNKYIVEAIIQRPLNLKRDAWYKHAREVCKQLNNEKENHA